MLSKMQSYIDGRLAKFLYNSLISPIISYCDFVYDGCPVTVKNRLQVAQNNALRPVKKYQRDYPTQQLRNSLEVDDLETARKKSTLKMVYRGVTNQGPPELNSMFDIYQAVRSGERLDALPGYDTPETSVLDSV